MQAAGCKGEEEGEEEQQQQQLTTVWRVYVWWGAWAAVPAAEVLAWGVRDWEVLADTCKRVVRQGLSGGIGAMWL